jgi:hypothetical protein
MQIEVKWAGRTNLQRAVATTYLNVTTYYNDRDEKTLELVSDGQTTVVNLRHVAAWTVTK